MLWAQPLIGSWDDIHIGLRASINMKPFLRGGPILWNIVEQAYEIQIDLLENMKEN